MVSSYFILVVRLCSTRLGRFTTRSGSGDLIIFVLVPCVLNVASGCQILWWEWQFFIIDVAGLLCRFFGPAYGSIILFYLLPYFATTQPNDTSLFLYLCWVVYSYYSLSWAIRWPTIYFSVLWSLLLPLLLPNLVWHFCFKSDLSHAWGMIYISSTDYQASLSYILFVLAHYIGDQWFLITWFSLHGLTNMFVHVC